MKLKIGVLSDTHLHRMTEHFKHIYTHYLADMDMILHAGDFVSDAVVKFLGRGNFHGVQGNMDPLEIKSTLPEKKVIASGPFRLGLIHGWGPSEGLEDRVRAEFRDVDVIVYGHSHRAVNHRREGILFFNPGTAIGYTSSGEHTLGVLEINDGIHGEIINIT